MKLPPLAATSCTTMPALGCTVDVAPDHRSLTEIDFPVWHGVRKRIGVVKYGGHTSISDVFE